MKALAKYLDTAAIAAVGGFEFDPKGLVAGNQAGAHKSPFHGFSVEFAGHREYIPGDDPKHIDWAVYYKRDRYMIKQYEAETNLVAQLLLDVSESMRFSSHNLTKLDYGAYLAVSLAYLITKARDKIGIGLFDETVRNYLPPSNNLATTYKMSRLIEEIKPEKKTDISRPLMEFANICGRRQIVVILSDFLTDLDDMLRGLARFRYDNHEVVVFHIMDPYEIDFPMEGRVLFKGLEGFEDIRLTPKSVRKAYLKRVEEHCFRLREICENNNAEYVRANTGRPVKELLFQYMTSRLTHIAR